ncbi:MAG: VWA domain-containing protein [Lentisphaeria bacterium]|nr:VWA domain-containing protein [Lentisphaeria bacterium]
MMMSLMHPWMLLLWLLIPAIAAVFRFYPRPSVTVSNLKPFRKAKSKMRSFSFLQWCIMLALIFIVAALSRPRMPQGNRIFRAKGLDIILALDMSGSMEAYDRPHGMNENAFVGKLRNGDVPTRLESAKNEIRRFILARPNDRIGLIGFADLAYSFVPPTLDHELLLTRLAALKCGELGSATGIASPIGNAVKRLKNSQAPRRVLVLFTDGANTAENRITPQAAAQTAKDLNVIIHTVGIGSDNAYAAISTPFGSSLQRIDNSLDHELLQELSAMTGGTYFPAADNNGMRRVMDEINSLERTDHSAPRSVSYREYAPALALTAALILLLGITGHTLGKLRLP